MIKDSVQYGLYFFSGMLIWQLLFRPEINWVDLIGITIVSSLFYLLFEWVDKRHEENEDK